MIGRLISRSLLILSDELMYCYSVLVKPVRTALDMDDNGLPTAKELACLHGPPAGESTSAVAGFRPFAARDSRLVSNEQIDQLRDEVGL